MKNIYILDEYNSSLQNGIGTFLRELTACLRRLDVTICLIEFNTPNREFEVNTEDGIKRIQFPLFARGGFLANYKIIDKFLRLFIEDNEDNLFMLNHSPCEKLLGAIKQSFPLSKITFTIHEFGWTSPLLGDAEKLHQLVYAENNTKDKKKHSRLIDYFHEEQRMYSICDRVICLSQDARDTLIATYKIPEEKVAMIPNGLSDTISSLPDKQKQLLRKKKGIEKTEYVFLFVGRAVQAKGIFSLFKAFKKILKKVPHCRLIIAGTIYDPASILKLGKDIAAKISYTGLISKEELADYYRIADIGMIPSYTEQCSYTGIEMMQFGLPVVSSDGYGVKRMFTDEVNALTAPIGNREKEREFSDNLANTILKLVESKNLQARIKAGSRKIYELRYSQEAMTRGYEKLLKELFEKR